MSEAGKRTIDLATWARKAHFEFFSGFDEPFFGVCVRVDCTKAYAAAKRRGCSFFLYYLYQSLRAAHVVEPFRYRIEDGGVVIYDRLGAGPAIDRPDGTFGYAYFTYSDDIDEFLRGAQSAVDQVRSSPDLKPSKATNTVLYSALPWLDFTSLSHARKFGLQDSRPRVTFGKMTTVEGRRSMPVAIHVNHALVDGRDVGEYVERFQGLMDSE